MRREDLDAFAIAPGALRENVVLAGLSPEVFVPGSLLMIGSTVAIRTIFLCEACKRIAHVVPSGFSAEMVQNLDRFIATKMAG